jgi:ribose/xylose/arabinose/galactoside ABC-type transport system permease subunit
MKKILRSREFTLFIFILIFIIIVSILSPAFLQMNNITNIINNSIPNIILGCGMTVVIITGGIEIAVGAEMVVASFIAGTVALMEGSNLFLVILVALVFGCIMGAINGSLIAFLKVPPIIATLGTLNVFRGALLYITKGKWIVNLPNWFTGITRDRFLGVPASIYVMITAVILTSLLLKYTKFGRSAYAIGGNRNSALYAGIKINHTLFGVYLYAGLMCGVAGFVNAARLGNIQPNGSVNLELTIIAAVVMGGTSILGGSGTAIGTLIGVIMMSLVDNTLILLYVPTYWQRFVLGAILIITITVNVIQKIYSDRLKTPIDVDEVLDEEGENV